MTSLEKLQENILEIQSMDLKKLAGETILEAADCDQHGAMLLQMAEKVSNAMNELSEAESILSQYLVNTFTS